MNRWKESASFEIVAIFTRLYSPGTSDFSFFFVKISNAISFSRHILTFSCYDPPK